VTKSPEIGGRTGCGKQPEARMTVAVRASSGSLAMLGAVTLGPTARTLDARRLAFILGNAPNPATSPNFDGQE